MGETVYTAPSSTYPHKKPFFSVSYGGSVSNGSHVWEKRKCVRKNLILFSDKKIFIRKAPQLALPLLLQTAAKAVS